MSTTKQRHEIITEALRIRAESKQIIIDTASWNENVRKPDEHEIEPDPDGELVRIIDGIERGMANELLAVHIIGPDELMAVDSLKDGDALVARMNAIFADFAKWPQMEARLVGWPGDAESHAKDCERNKADDAALKGA